MILVVGATGMVGSEICQRLSSRGEKVRALVRTTSSAYKVAKSASVAALSPCSTAPINNEIAGCVFSSSKSASSLGEKTHCKNAAFALHFSKRQRRLPFTWKHEPRKISPARPKKGLFVILPHSGNFRHNRALPRSACTLTRSKLFGFHFQF